MNITEFNKSFILIINTSKYVIGIILSQIKKDDVTFSKKLINTNELLAMVKVSECFRIHLIGKKSRLIKLIIQML